MRQHQLLVRRNELLMRLVPRNKKGSNPLCSVSINYRQQWVMIKNKPPDFTAGLSNQLLRKELQFISLTMNQRLLKQLLIGISQLSN